MSISYGFFNATETGGVYDREYTADQLSAYLDKIVGNGVFNSPSTSLQVLAKSTPDMTINLKAGKGWIDGYWIKNDADYSISISSASATLNRIDRIVFKWDFTNREMSVVVKEGTPASTPVAPVVTRNATVKEYSLATILISANQTTITQSKITDTRSDNTVCGWVTSLIEQIDTTTLFNQYQDAQERFIDEQQTAFDEWFEDVQSTLASATILRRYSNSVTTVAEQTEYQIGITPFNSTIDTLNVLMNGIRLIPTTEYTFTNSSVTLVNAPSAGQSLDFEVFRNVNGADCVTVIEDVEELQTQMARELKYKYYATGTDDNIAINAIINNFYNATEQFAGIAADSQLSLEVIGELGITEISSGGQTLFVWTKPVNSQKRIYVDFGNCSKITHSSNSNIIAIKAESVTISKLNMSVTSTIGNAYAIQGQSIIINDCNLEVYGITSAVGIIGFGRIDNTFIKTFASTGFSTGISLAAGITRITGGYIASYKSTGSTNTNINGIFSNVAGAIITATNVYFPSSSVTGYTQVNSIRLSAGKYSLLGCIIGVAKNLTGATGTETGSIDLT